MKKQFPFHSNAVWPPFGIVLFFAIAYGMTELGLRIIERATGDVHVDFSSIREIQQVRATVVEFTAGFYALFRLWRFHPACNRSYAFWLRVSPWTPAKPLPLGPVHLVWQDAVVIGFLAALALWHVHVSPTLPVLAFGATYLLGLMLLFAVLRAWRPCLLLAFLWPALALPAFQGLPSLGIVAAIILATWYGYHTSLRTFSWQGGSADVAIPDRTKPLLQTEIRIRWFEKNPASQPQDFGWPLQWLSPKAVEPPIATSTCLALGAVFGWWTYCAAVGSRADIAPELILVFGLIGALVRLGIYCTGFAPPFNLWGRFRSGRIVVPGFDHVFVTPLIVAALAIVGGVVVRRAGPWNAPVGSLVVGLICFALLNGPPTMKRWILTGQHRYRPPSRLGGTNRMLRPI